MSIVQIFQEEESLIWISSMKLLQV